MPKANVKARERFSWSEAQLRSILKEKVELAGSDDDLIELAVWVPPHMRLVKTKTGKIKHTSVAGYWRSGKPGKTGIPESEALKMKGVPPVPPWLKEKGGEGHKPTNKVSQEVAVEAGLLKPEAAKAVDPKKAAAAAKKAEAEAIPSTHAVMTATQTEIYYIHDPAMGEVTSDPIPPEAGVFESADGTIAVVSPGKGAPVVQYPPEGGKTEGVGGAGTLFGYVNDEKWKELKQAQAELKVTEEAPEVPTPVTIEDEAVLLETVKTITGNPNVIAAPGDSVYEGDQNFVGVVHPDKSVSVYQPQKGAIPKEYPAGSSVASQMIENVSTPEGLAQTKWKLVAGPDLMGTVAGPDLTPPPQVHIISQSVTGPETAEIAWTDDMGDPQIFEVPEGGRVYTGSPAGIAVLLPGTMYVWSADGSFKTEDDPDGAKAKQIEQSPTWEKVFPTLEQPEPPVGVTWHPEIGALILPNGETRDLEPGEKLFAQKGGEVYLVRSISGKWEGYSSSYEPPNYALTFQESVYEAAYQNGTLFGTWTQLYGETAVSTTTPGVVEGLEDYKPTVISNPDGVTIQYLNLAKDEILKAKFGSDVPVYMSPGGDIAVLDQSQNAVFKFYSGGAGSESIDVTGKWDAVQSTYIDSELWELVAGPEPEPTTAVPATFVPGPNPVIESVEHPYDVVWTDTVWEFKSGVIVVDHGDGTFSRWSEYGVYKHYDHDPQFAFGAAKQVYPKVGAKTIAGKTVTPVTEETIYTTPGGTSVTIQPGEFPFYAPKTADQPNASGAMMVFSPDLTSATYYPGHPMTEGDSTTYTGAAATGMVAEPHWLPYSPAVPSGEPEVFYTDESPAPRIKMPTGSVYISKHDDTVWVIPSDPFGGSVLVLHGDDTWSRWGANTGWEREDFEVGDITPPVLTPPIYDLTVEPKTYQAQAPATGTDATPFDVLALKYTDGQVVVKYSGTGEFAIPADAFVIQSQNTNLVVFRTSEGKWHRIQNGGVSDVVKSDHIASYETMFSEANAADQMVVSPGVAGGEWVVVQMPTVVQPQTLQTEVGTSYTVMPGEAYYSVDSSTIALIVHPDGSTVHWEGGHAVTLDANNAWSVGAVHNIKTNAPESQWKHLAGVDITATDAAQTKVAQATKAIKAKAAKAPVLKTPVPKAVSKAKPDKVGKYNFPYSAETFDWTEVRDELYDRFTGGQTKYNWEIHKTETIGGVPGWSDMSARERIEEMAKPDNLAYLDARIEQLQAFKSDPSVDKSTKLSVGKTRTKLEAMSKVLKAARKAFDGQGTIEEFEAAVEKTKKPFVIQKDPYGNPISLVKLYDDLVETKDSMVAQVHSEQLGFDQTAPLKKIQKWLVDSNVSSWVGMTEEQQRDYLAAWLHDPTVKEKYKQTSWPYKALDYDEIQDLLVYKASVAIFVDTVTHAHEEHVKQQAAEQAAKKPGPGEEAPAGVEPPAVPHLGIPTLPPHQLLTTVNSDKVLNTYIKAHGGNYVGKMTKVDKALWIRYDAIGNAIGKYALEMKAVHKTKFKSGAPTHVLADTHPGSPDSPAGQAARQALSDFAGSRSWGPWYLPEVTPPVSEWPTDVVYDMWNDLGFGVLSPEAPSDAAIRDELQEFVGLVPGGELPIPSGSLNIDTGLPENQIQVVMATPGMTLAISPGDKVYITKGKPETDVLVWKDNGEVWGTKNGGMSFAKMVDSPVGLDPDEAEDNGDLEQFSPDPVPNLGVIHGQALVEGDVVYTLGPDADPAVAHYYVHHKDGSWTWVQPNGAAQLHESSYYQQSLEDGSFVYATDINWDVAPGGSTAGKVVTVAQPDEFGTIHGYPLKAGDSVWASVEKSGILDVMHADGTLTALEKNDAGPGEAWDTNEYDQETGDYFKNTVIAQGKVKPYGGPWDTPPGGELPATLGTIHGYELQPGDTAYEDIFGPKGEKLFAFIVHADQVSGVTVASDGDVTSWTGEGNVASAQKGSVWSGPWDVEPSTGESIALQNGEVLALKPGDQVYQSIDAASEVWVKHVDGSWSGSNPSGGVVEYEPAPPGPGIGAPSLETALASGTLVPFTGQKFGAVKKAPLTSPAGVATVVKPDAVPDATWEFVQGIEEIDEMPASFALAAPEIASQTEEQMRATVTQLISDMELADLPNAPLNVVRAYLWGRNSENAPEAMGLAIETRARAGLYAGSKPPGFYGAIKLPSMKSAVLLKPGDKVYQDDAEFEVSSVYIVAADGSVLSIKMSDGSLIASGPGDSGSKLIAAQISAGQKKKYIPTGPVTVEPVPVTKEKAQELGWPVSGNDWAWSQMMEKVDEDFWPDYLPTSQIEIDKEASKLFGPVFAENAPAAVRRNAVAMHQNGTMTPQRAELLKKKAEWGHWGFKSGKPYIDMSRSYAKYVALGAIDYDGVGSWAYQARQDFISDFGLSSVDQIPEKLHELFERPKPSTFKIDPTEPLTFHEFTPEFMKGKEHGMHTKAWYRDQWGRPWLSKPMPSGGNFRVDAEVAANTIGRMLGFLTPYAEARDMPNGDHAFAQLVVEPDSPLLAGVPPTDLSDSELYDTMSEHLLDYVVANGDSNGNQIVRGQKHVFGIDKGQAFRFFPEDQLAVGWHPSGQQPVYYDSVYAAIKNGGITKERADEAIRKVLLRAKRLSYARDDEFRQQLVMGFKERTDFNGMTREAFIDALVDRKHQSPYDFEKLYKGIYAEAGLEWTVPPIDELEDPYIPLSENEGDRAYLGVTSDLLARVEQTKAAGTAALFAGDDLEESHILFYTQKQQDGNSLLMGEARLLHPADDRLSAWIASQAVTTASGQKTATVESTDPAAVLPGRSQWLEALVGGAKTVNHHSVEPPGSSPDAEYNEERINAMLKAKQEMWDQREIVISWLELNKGKKHPAPLPLTKGPASGYKLIDIDQGKAFLEMTDTYLGYITEIEVAKDNQGKTPSKSYAAFEWTPKPKPKVIEEYEGGPDGLQVLKKFDDGHWELTDPEVEGGAPQDVTVAKAKKLKKTFEAAQQIELGGLPPISVIKRHASSVAGELNVETGELTLTGDDVPHGNVGSRYDIRIGDDAVIEYRPWKEQSVPLTQQGLLRIYVKDWNGGPEKVEEALDFLRTAGIDLTAADETSLRLSYWSQWTAISKNRANVPKDVQTLIGAWDDWLAENPNATPEQRLEKIQALWAQHYGEDTVENVDWRPHFSHGFPQDPKLMTGKPYWYRPEPLPKYTKFPSHGFTGGYSNQATAAVKSGGLMSFEERLRHLGKYLPGTSSDEAKSGSHNDQTTGGAASDFFYINSGSGAVLLTPEVYRRMTSAAFDHDAWGSAKQKKDNTEWELSKLMHMGPNGELIVKNETTLLDDWVAVAVPHDERTSLIEWLKARGIETIRGIPVEERIIAGSDVSPSVAEKLWKRELEWRSEQELKAAA